ncbi:Exosome complex component RRP43, partial [Irineochytrium annulatum]
MSATTPADAFALDPETFKKIHPVEYHRRFFNQNLRPDGRTLDRFRAFKVDSGWCRLVKVLMIAETDCFDTGSISTAVGSSMVRLGETICVCGVKAEVGIPKPNTPTEGYFVPNVDLPPLCSPSFRPGPPSELAQSTSEYLYQVFSKSKVIDLETLCIEEGKAVWVIYADVVFLNYEGGALDAAFAAVVAAMKNATYHETEKLVKSNNIFAIPLPVRKSPLSATFGIFQGADGRRKMIMADPTEEEECVVLASVTV